MPNIRNVNFLQSKNLKIRIFTLYYIHTARVYYSARLATGNVF